jgi:hypothetical protein
MTGAISIIKLGSPGPGIVEVDRLLAVIRP